MLAIIVASAFLYASCFGFYQWNRRRTGFERLRTDARLRRAVLALSWGLAIISLVMFAAASGWARGVPIWLGGLTIAGAANLVSASLFPKPHLAGGVFSVALAIIGAASLMLRVGS